MKVTGRQVPAAWFAGVARLQFMAPPEGFKASRWRRLLIDAAVLLEEFGSELHRLGWSELDLFGIHPTAPATAVQCFGLAACMNGGRVEDVQADYAAIRQATGSILTYRRKPMLGAIPIWDYRAEGCFSVILPSAA